MLRTGYHILTIFIFAVTATSGQKNIIPSSVTGTCGGTFRNAKSGYLASPGFPAENYPDNANCTFYIEADAGSVVTYKTLFMDVEDRGDGSSDCNYDFIELYDRDILLGSRLTGGRKFCGTELIPLNSTTGNTLRVNFVSDELTNKKGFVLQWSILNPADLRPSFNCDFDGPTPLCPGWRQSAADNADWRFARRKTPTLSTGPLEDHSQDTENGRYAYIEASEMDDGHNAILMSPNVPAEDEQAFCLRFWYHMHGTGMGQLRVAKFEGSDQGTFIFNTSGYQENNWLQAEMNIKGTGVPFEVYFIGYRGSSLYSDIAIDDISLTPERCNPEVTVTDATGTEYSMFFTGTWETRVVTVPGCTEDQFSCNDGFGCIEKSEVCDDIVDCLDGSDENNCDEASCPEGFEWQTCGSSCNRTCSDGKNDPPCSLNCVPRCGCPSDKPVLDKNKCITYEECPLSEIPLDVVDDATITRTDLTTADITFKPVRAALSYKILISTVTNEVAVPIEISVENSEDEISTTFTGLTPGMKYEVKIFSVKGDTEVGSSVLEFTTNSDDYVTTEFDTSVSLFGTVTGTFSEIATTEANQVEATTASSEETTPFLPWTIMETTNFDEEITTKKDDKEVTMKIDGDDDEETTTGISFFLTGTTDSGKKVTKINDVNEETTGTTDSTVGSTTSDNVKEETTTGIPFFLTGTTNFDEDIMTSDDVNEETTTFVPLFVTGTTESDQVITTNVDENAETTTFGLGTFFTTGASEITSPEPTTTTKEEIIKTAATTFSWYTSGIAKYAFSPTSGDTTEEETITTTTIIRQDTTHQVNNSTTTFSLHEKTTMPETLVTEEGTVVTGMVMPEPTTLPETMATTSDENTYTQFERLEVGKGITIFSDMTEEGTYESNYAKIFNFRTQPGYIVRVTFTKLSLFCEDGIHVFDGFFDGDKITTICGTELDPLKQRLPVIYSYSDMITLLFQTDEINESSGFEAVVDSVSVSTIVKMSCGDVISDLTGQISSPNFPDVNAVSKCQYSVNLEKHQYMDIDFHSINLGKKSHDQTCNNGSLLIQSFNSSVELCGIFPPPIFTITGNVTIQLDADIPHGGFFLNYEIKECSVEGQIFSNYPTPCDDICINESIASCSLTSSKPRCYCPPDRPIHLENRCITVPECVGAIDQTTTFTETEAASMTTETSTQAMIEITTQEGSGVLELNGTTTDKIEKRVEASSATDYPDIFVTTDDDDGSGTLVPRVISTTATATPFFDIFTTDDNIGTTEQDIVSTTEELDETTTPAVDYFTTDDSIDTITPTSDIFRTDNITVTTQKNIVTTTSVTVDTTKPPVVDIFTTEDNVGTTEESIVPTTDFSGTVTPIIDITTDNFIKTTEKNIISTVDIDFTTKPVIEIVTTARTTQLVEETTNDDETNTRPSIKVHTTAKHSTSTYSEIIPKDLMILNITTSTVCFSFTSNKKVPYEVLILGSGDVSPLSFEISHIVPNSAHRQCIDTLIPGTLYNIQVRSVQNGFKGQWETLIFRTFNEEYILAETVKILVDLACIQISNAIKTDSYLFVTGAANSSEVSSLQIIAKEKTLYKCFQRLLSDTHYTVNISSTSDVSYRQNFVSIYFRTLTATTEETQYEQTRELKEWRTNYFQWRSTFTAWIETFTSYAATQKAEDTKFECPRQTQIPPCNGDPVLITDVNGCQLIFCSSLLIEEGDITQRDIIGWKEENEIFKDYFLPQWENMFNQYITLQEGKKDA